MSSHNSILLMLPTNSSTAQVEKWEEGREGAGSGGESSIAQVAYPGQQSKELFVSLCCV